jgi:3-oxoacyl-[acyl-carrier protein] reductase
MIDPGLQGKVAIVTGANHGIGAAAAQALAAQGVAVLINFLRIPPAGGVGSRTDEAESTTPGLAYYNRQRNRTAEEVVLAIREKGGRAEAVEADLADLATIPLLFERAETLFGPVDILVNNADYCMADTFQSGSAALAPSGYATTEISPEIHDRHFAVNSRAVALLIAEFARRCRAAGMQWGRIISITTDGAPGFFREISYGASKYALESYTRAAAEELGLSGITANIVSPGPVQTGWIMPELERRVVAETPLGRVGQPEDLADVIVFLASEQARWVTGQMISVSGGRRKF